MSKQQGKVETVEKFKLRIAAIVHALRLTAHCG
jgi:hypothetical protein